MRVLALLNPSRHDFGSLQRWKPFGSSGGLFPLVCYFYAAFQHQTDSVVTPSSSTTGALGTGFPFTSRDLAFSLFQRRRTQTLGFRSSSILICNDVFLPRGLMMVPDRWRLFSRPVLWDSIQLWDLGSTLIIYDEARGFSIGAGKVDVGFLRVVHRWRTGGGSAMVDELNLVLIRPVLVVVGFGRVCHNGMIQTKWVLNVCWVPSVCWVLNVVGVPKDVCVQFRHGFKVWDPGEIRVFNFDGALLKFGPNQI